MPPRAEHPTPADWENLGAFADGELAVAEQREVAALISRLPEAAETLRGIVRLKEQLQALPLAETPPPPRIGGTAAAKRRPRLRNLAAAVALAFVAGAALLALHPDAGPQADRFLAASLAAHERHAEAGPAIGVIAASATPVAAELSLLGLRPAWRSAGAPGEEHVGFTGVHGCRLSLHVTTAPQADAPDAPDGSPHALARWKAAGSSYLLIATDMPTARFTIVSGFLKALTARSPADLEPLRTALQQDWRAAPACLA